MGGYTNECGKFFNNPIMDGSVNAQPTCTEKEIKEYQKSTKKSQMRSCEDILNDNTRSPYRIEKYNKCLENKQQNRPFYKKHSDTIRTILIIGVAYYIWKSGMINKILK